MLVERDDLAAQLRAGWCEPLIPHRPLVPWGDVARALELAPNDNPGPELLDHLSRRRLVLVIEDGH